MQKEIIEVLKIVIIVAAFTALLFPMIKWISYHVGALDYPNERKVHKKPMPRLGGLAIYSAFLFGYIMYGSVTTQMISILISSFILVLLGVFDDIKPISSKTKILIHIIVASIVVFYGKLYLRRAYEKVGAGYWHGKNWRCNE